MMPLVVSPVSLLVTLSKTPSQKISPRSPVGNKKTKQQKIIAKKIFPQLCSSKRK
jgi:hypothetical protein